MYNCREKYQGLEAPTIRSEKDFDPGAKYHIPNYTPYARLNFILISFNIIYSTFIFTNFLDTL